MENKEETVIENTVVENENKPKQSLSSNDETKVEVGDYITTFFGKRKQRLHCLKVVKAYGRKNTCKGCYFRFRGCSRGVAPCCSGLFRKDKNDIIFVRKPMFEMLMRIVVKILGDKKIVQI